MAGSSLATIYAGGKAAKVHNMNAAIQIIAISLGIICAGISATPYISSGKTSTPKFLERISLIPFDNKGPEILRLILKLNQ